MPTLIRRHLATSLGLALVLAPPLSAQAPAEGDLGHVDGDPEAPVVVVIRDGDGPVDVQTEGDRREMPLQEVADWFQKR